MGSARRPHRRARLRDRRFDTGRRQTMSATNSRARRPAHHMKDCHARQRFARSGTRKEVRSAWWPQAPVRPQRRQQPRAQHDVAILVPLSRSHPDQHPLAVDVGRNQRTQLAHPQASPIGDHQHRAVLRPTHGTEQPLDLRNAQDLRQSLAHPAGERDASHLAGAVQCHPVETLPSRSPWLGPAVAKPM